MSDTTRYDLVVVSGPDAVTYLQGQLSQDVVALVVGATAPSFLLEPNGKVCAWVQVHRRADDRFALWVDAGFGAAVAERLGRFKLRTKVDIEVVDDPGSEPDAPAARPEDERITAGVPRMGAELEPGQTIPAEAGQAVIDGSVSFTKGCYTGQELVARIDSRGGNVPRQLRALAFAAPDGGGPAESGLPPVGADVEVDGSAVGRVTSVAWSPARGAAVALGYVARAVEPPAGGVVRWEGGEAAVQVSVLVPPAGPERGDP